MTALQALIIAGVSGITGLLVISTLLSFLFRSARTPNGILQKFIITTGKNISTKLASSGIADQYISNPSILEKLKPEIEQHVDAFLDEKLSTVFPLLYKFMGDKTRFQFKQAFMAETEILFPVVIRKYFDSVKNEISLSDLIHKYTEHINYPELFQKLRTTAAKEILLFRISGFVLGLLMGGIMIALLKISGM